MQANEEAQINEMYEEFVTSYKGEGSEPKFTNRINRILWVIHLKNIHYIGIFLMQDRQYTASWLTC